MHIFSRFGILTWVGTGWECHLDTNCGKILRVVPKNN